MRIPVRHKLITTYLIISVLTAIFTYLLTYLTSEQRINALAKDYQLKEISQEVYNWYAAERQWKGFSDYFKTLHPPRQHRKPDTSTSTHNGPIKRHGVVTSEQKSLLHFLHFKPGDTVPKAYLANANEVRFDEKTVAWVIPVDAIGISLNSEMQIFLTNIREILLIAVSVSVLISLLMGIVLARILLKPVESLTKASSAIADGNLQQQVPAYTDDEIGDLSRSFNKMSQDLVNADTQRRQITADIAHDLGTPVQVISGYIEMAQDGELELNQERIDTIADELEHIQRLLKDMSLLAQTDAKTLSLQLTKTSIKPLLERVVKLYSCQDKQVKLSLDCPDFLPALVLDEDRIVQVLGNLISNALRHTPEGGEITIQSQTRDNQLTIQVVDNGCGISPEDLPLVFDRFYRSDPARNGSSGNMGLGLSISKGLVEMQGGKIGVKSDGKSGSCFLITFPIEVL
ncbi:cell wall metabolism sensor histidine kinase WalK [Photobacterium sp. OFAV2-7]|uniref:sensor histidine kinase n=1 Tax=Photobacterium sp. OFAV2-7 TaxID=2917748 RepID=UPI001EF74E34|nr:HAMP domain-containing sensor histidine kinase [Photobacterium sp. OFAV2-7]MCG7587948.1 HAMP domain-containing histidine kinase [Photobacterium sp. OFAV2-7]